MRRIETEYVLPRDTNFTVTLREDTVVLPQAVMDKTTEAQPSRSMVLPSSNTSAGFRITAGGLRLRR